MLKFKKDSFEVRCESCGAKMTIDTNDFNNDDIEFIEHGSNCMGTEVSHNFTFESECSKCGQEIQITINGNEYPEGCLDSSEVGALGCEFITQPEIECELS